MMHMHELTLLEILEKCLQRKLTEEEKRKVEWLEGWERDTVDTFKKLCIELHTQGYLQAGGNIADLLKVKY